MWNRKQHEIDHLKAELEHYDKTILRIIHGGHLVIKVTLQDICKTLRYVDVPGEHSLIYLSRNVAENDVTVEYREPDPPRIPETRPAELNPYGTEVR